MISFNINGSYSLDHQTIPFLFGVGTTRLNHIICKGTVNSAGDLFAKECVLEKVRSAGDSVFEKSLSKDFKGSGSTRLIGCNMESVSTAGHLYIDDSEVEQLQHAGHLDIKKSKIKNVCHSGSLEIESSKVEDTLTSSAKNMRIYNSQIKTIHVQPHQNSRLKIFGFDLFSSRISPEQQIVELIGKDCKIESIIFEKGSKGQVVQKEGALFKELKHIN